MKNETMQKLLGALTLMLAITMAYKGLLIVGILISALAVFLLVTDLDLFKGEEEETEEEES